MLLVHSLGRDFSPFSEAVSRFRIELSSRYGHPVSFFEVSLEGTSFDDQSRHEPLSHYLHGVYQDAPPDLIVPIGAQAGKFWALHRETLFAGVPALLFSVEGRRVEEIWQDTGVTSVGLDLDSGALVENILNLRPNTRELYVISGTSQMERFWEEQYRKEWASFEDRVTFHWLNNQSLKEMMTTVADLPPDSAILFIFLNRDAAGITYETGVALRALAKEANVPMFGSLQQQLGLGIVGGPLYPARHMASRASQYGSRILSGTPASKLKPNLIPLTRPMYDARQLKRWKIPNSRLPEENSVLGRSPSLWKTHRNAVLAAVSVIGALAFTILLLFGARRRARDAASRLSLAAESGNIGLWERNPDSNTIIASNRWREIFGLDQEDPVDVEEVISRIHPDDKDRLLGAVKAASENGTPFTLEHRVSLPDGTVRWVSSYGQISPNHGEKGDLTKSYFRGASIDITARHEAETNAEIQRQELAHLSRVSSLGVLSGALVHEMNQPLGIILSNAQAAEKILESDAPDLVELREIISDIVDEDKRAGNVIHRLRALLSRSETSLTTVDVNENIREALRLTRSNLLVTQVHVELHLSETLPPVEADRVQLQQTILNLIVNACDAMSSVPVEKRILTIESSLQEKEILIAVRDCGVGLPENPEELFEPFHTTKETGLGLGLAICRTLVMSHRGRLWAEPEACGGAAFFLALPIQTEQTDSP